MNHIIPKLTKTHLNFKKYEWEEYGKLVKFDQLQFIKSEEIPTEPIQALADYGYVFIPNACLEKYDEPPECHLHIHFHGMGQSAQYCDSLYVEQSGFLQWAANNNMVVLFP